MMSRAPGLAQAVPDAPGVPDGHAAPAARPAPATRPGRDPAPARAGGRVTATRGLVAASDAQAGWANTRALIVVLALALVYTVIAIANAPVIAVASRRAGLGALRLAGATRAQVLRLAGTEAALVAALGTGLAAVVTAVTVAAVRRRPAGVAAPSGAAVPWVPLAAIGLVCLVVAVLGSVLAAAAALRDPGQTLAAAAGA